MHYILNTNQLSDWFFVVRKHNHVFFIRCFIHTYVFKKYNLLLWINVHCNCVARITFKKRWHIQGALTMRKTIFKITLWWQIVRKTSINFSECRNYCNINTHVMHSTQRGRSGRFDSIGYFLKDHSYVKKLTSGQFFHSDFLILLFTL